ncbi:hypothetical protein Gotri_016672 [Gossypium trilobum]|uniref:Uncharacterized protein n=1 Tax=Gossypium trilobum TaxID=34281 RepID=A0A7J9E472_9ROSI|nr:hypothetical protein [Gossypium trilobum]
MVSGHSSTVWSLAFNAKGDKLVTYSDDLTLKIWEADIIRMQSGDGYAPWNHLCTLSGFHDRTIFSVHCSSFNLKPIVYGLRPLQEGIIASGAADDAVRLFVESKDGSTCESTYCVILLASHSLIYFLVLFQMIGPPLYQLLLKKEKAQDNGALG